MLAIEDYIGKASRADIAEGYIERLTERCLATAGVPHGGTPRPDLGRHLRSVPFERSATILYRARRDEIVIVAVFYGGQDIAARMKRRSR